MDTLTPTTTCAREILSDDERRARHARSMALYDASIRTSLIGTILSAVGIAFWPLIVVGAVLLAAGCIVSRKAKRVSPYSGELC